MSRFWLRLALGLVIVAGIWPWRWPAAAPDSAPSAEARPARAGDTIPPSLVATLTPAEPHVGDAVTVTVALTSPITLAAAAFDLRFDPSRFEAAPARSATGAEVRVETGRGVIHYRSSTGRTAANGATALTVATFELKATAAGQSRLQLGAVDLRDGSGQAVRVLPEVAPVTVVPPPGPTGDSVFFTWYDGKNFEPSTLIVDDSAGCFESVRLGSQLLGMYQMPAAGYLALSYPGVMGGPVTVASSCGQAQATERLVYHGAFSEVHGVPLTQTAATYWLSWYDSVSFDQQYLMIANPDPSNPVSVSVSIGGQPVADRTIDPGTTLPLFFPGVQAGPVLVTASQLTFGGPVVSLRTVYRDGFKEVAATNLYASRMRWTLPWYDNAAGSGWLMVYNTGQAPTTAGVFIGGTLRQSVDVPAGGQTIVQLGNFAGGPVDVVADPSAPQPLLVSTRSVFRGSFDEAVFVSPYYSGALETPGYLWYDSANPNVADEWIVVANPNPFAMRATVNFGGTASESVDLGPYGAATPERRGLAVHGVQVSGFPTNFGSVGLNLSAVTGLVVAKRTVYNNRFAQLAPIRPVRPIPPAPFPIPSPAPVPCFVVAPGFVFPGCPTPTPVAGAPTLSGFGTVSGYVTLNWTAVANATGYRVYRTGPDGAFSVVGTVSADTLRFNDNLAPGLRRTYYVVAVVGNIEGTKSNEVRIEL